MNKNIVIDIMKKDDLFEKYNQKIIKRELVNYLIESTPIVSNEDVITIIITSKIKEDLDIVELIKNGLKKEYSISINRNYRDNLTQFIYLIIGVIGIFISTLIHETVLKEIILIGGWVFIWALLEMEIFTDLKGRRRRKIIEKLLKSKYELKK